MTPHAEHLLKVKANRDKVWPPVVVVYAGQEFKCPTLKDWETVLAMLQAKIDVARASVKNQLTAFEKAGKGKSRCR